ncbi:MAG: superoxide dismutase [Alphaproteobacteria bacterium]|nr:superoxide dismutase [Alphaproteobacteria bacterium]
MTFELPELPYAYDALAPYMSAETLEYHHDRHHKAYVDKGNDLLKGSGLEGKSLEEIVAASFKDPAKGALFNNAGQHWNHMQFWNWMKPNGGGSIPGGLDNAIKDSFGSFDTFRGKFIEAGVTQFGSGWCWLVLNDKGNLEIMKTPNAENPLAHGKKALLGCDVWEHSYYIDYRNARPKYLEAFIDNLVNWDYVGELFAKA